MPLACQCKLVSEMLQCPLEFPAVRQTDYFYTFFLAGKLRKIRNHVAHFGSTGAMATAGSCLVSAGYDLDRGNGYLNGNQKCSLKLSFVVVQMLEVIFDAEQMLMLRFLQTCVLSL